MNDRWVEQENIKPNMWKSERKGNYSIWFKSAFWILLNFFAIAISGVLWHEFCFSILVFLEIYFLRPYAGGYHADTEIKCCMISVGIVNIAMLVRKINVISLDCMFVIYLCFICVIVLFSPVDNPIHPLSKVDSRFYAKRSRQLIFWYSFLLVISICLLYTSPSPRD